MRYWQGGWWWTMGLVSAGLLLLALNLGFFVVYEPWVQYGLALALAATGSSFFVGYVRTREQWWRLIPGWTMVVLALMLLFSTAKTPSLRFIAALLFWGMGAAFFHIYWLHRVQHWWAIIPGGFMLVLGIIIALSGVVADIELLGALLFVGMGLVFYLLYALNNTERQWWALIPALVLGLFGFFMAVAQHSGEGTFVRWWPLFLILAGLFTGWRTYKSVSGVQPAPRTSLVSTIRRTATPNNEILVEVDHAG